MSRRIARLLISLSIVALISACDQESGPPARHPHDASTADEAGRLVEQVKDALAEDRIGQAMTLMERLLAIRNTQPPARQIEIDRLDAMFAAERVPNPTRP